MQKLTHENEIPSIKLDAVKVAERAKREEKAASLTAEQRAKAILRNRTIDRGRF